MRNNTSWFQKGLRDGLPIALGYLAVSFTLGIAAKKAGIGALQATLMSVTNNTSAGQFAAMGLISAGGTYLEMAITQLVVNIRYLLMSAALSQKLDEKLPLRHRFLMAYTVTDEVFGVSVSTVGKLNPFYSYGAITVAAIGWASGTCLGVVTGNVLPARFLSAFSVALYGMFLAVIIPPSKGNKVLTGLIACAMLASFLFTHLPVVREISSGFRIIILTVLIAGAAAVLFPVKEEAHES